MSLSMFSIGQLHRRVKTPSVLQMEISECGAACLAMILAYYGRYVPLEKLRVDCGVTRDGVKASNMIRAAEKYNLTGRGFRREPHQLAEMRPPMIIHWNFNHFVVFEGFSKGKACINDPAAGHRVLSMEEFDLSFTGVTLTFDPTPLFQPGGRRDSFYDAAKRRLSGAKNVLVFLCLVGLLMLIPGIVVPSFSRILMDDLLVGGRTGWLGPLLWAMAGAALLQGLLTALQQKYLLRMETKIALMGASSFLWHVLRLPVLFLQQRSPGDITSRVSSNDTIAAFLSRDLAENALGLLTLIFYFLVMLRYSVLLTLLCLLIAALNIVYLLYASDHIEELNRRIQQDSGKLYGTAVSGLYMIETLKATGAESGFFSKWAGLHARQLNGMQQAGKTIQLLSALPGFLSGLAELLVLCIGGLQIMEGSMTVGDLVAYRGLMGSFMSPVTGLTQMGMRIRQLKADMARLDDVMEYEADPDNDPERDTLYQDLPEEELFRKLEGYVEIRNLAYGYNLYEPPFLTGLNLRLRPGMQIALVGASGSGKSTVAKLIAGLHKPWSGQIRYDNKPRDSIPRVVINNSLAVVDQDIRLFAGSILDNLTMWDSTIPYQDMVQAAKDACIHDEISLRPGGYQSPVEEGGGNFSGGQRQRLEIARALAINPSVLILDEATSALDTTTEQKVTENIRRRGCTCIIVAHRLSTIRDCDEIIVLDHGKVVQRGDHQQLVDAPGIYAGLIRSEA